MPRLPGVALQLGLVTTYMSLVVLIPLAAVVVKATDLGWDAFWNAVTGPQAMAALKLTLGVSLLVAVINALAGTLIAWVLVRDSFRGKGFVNSLIDLPFALPTIVAGLTLLALYGPKTPVGDRRRLHADRDRAGAAVRDAAVRRPGGPAGPDGARPGDGGGVRLARRRAAGRRSAGSSCRTSYPAILAGVGLAFARAVGEFGSLVLISGNLPFKTEVASVFIFGQIESDRVETAAAVSVVLLAISLLVLLGISALSRWGSRHDGG